MTDVKVSIGMEFLNAYSNIAHSEQKRVREFIEKFWENPRSSAINYEKLHDMKDKNVRTVRINDAYRAVVLNPESGNNFILVWVDHHDEAMRWAKNKKFSVNKYTGAIEVLDYEFIDKIKEEEKRTLGRKPLFHAAGDDDLLLFGVPQVLLTAVKNIDSETALDELAKYLPSEASEALYFLASGYTVEQTLCEITSRNAKPATPTADADFDAALENEHSQRRFMAVGDASELAAVLDAPLDKWRVFIHPAQRKLIEMKTSGPTLVLGGAGTGKTVVAMHRAKHLAEKVFNGPDDKILFTTFSKSLANDIRENISRICSAEAMSRIEITNIDSWMTSFLYRRGYKFQIATDAELKRFWLDAMKFAPAEMISGGPAGEAFFREEWRNVILPNAIHALDDYLKAPNPTRPGSQSPAARGSAEIRRAAWPVFESLRGSFKEKERFDLADLLKMALSHLDSNPRDIPSYRAVIVDEGQDIGPGHFRLIRKIVPPGPDDIFIAGDCHQKIYAQKVMLSECGINVRGNAFFDFILKPLKPLLTSLGVNLNERRVHKLKLNYRTTEETRRWALKMLDSQTIDDLDGGTDSDEGCRSLLKGADPAVKTFAAEKEEYDYLVKYTGNLIADGAAPESICLVARTNELVTRCRDHFSAAGLRVCQISRDAVDRAENPGIRFSTMHRVKGLEFDHIVITSAGEGIIPLKRVIDETSDEFARREADSRERSLLYVAATRAKKSVMITCSGRISGYVDTQKNNH